MGKAELDGALGRKVGVFCSEGLDALGREAAAVREDLREGLAGLHETPAGFLQRKCRAACPLGDQRVVNHELCMGAIRRSSPPIKITAPMDAANSRQTVRMGHDARRMAS